MCVNYAQNDPFFPYRKATRNGDIMSRMKTSKPTGFSLISVRLLITVLLAAVFLPAFADRPGVVLSCLHSFNVFANRQTPVAELVEGGDGNFYGTTFWGGTNGGNGTIFRISTNGILTSLHSFRGGIDGANPQAGLAQGRDGNFYGTTFYGGMGSNGTVFKISADGSFSGLYVFTGGDDGGNPEAGLVQGSDGTFYGTTFSGGTNGYGTVFKISANGSFRSLYSFNGGDDGNGLQKCLV